MMQEGWWPDLTLARLLLEGRFFYRFMSGVLFSVAFSISVILVTVGIMDGYEDLLKSGLRGACGDFLLSSHEGQLTWSRPIRKMLQAFNITQYTSLVQTEAFLIHDEDSLGVLVKGIDPASFNRVSKLQVQVGKDEIVVGEELAHKMHLSLGSEVVLALSRGQNNFSGLPLLKRFRVREIVKHGIYKQDLRFVYVLKEQLGQAMHLEGHFNLLAFNIPPQSLQDNGEKVMDVLENLRPLIQASVGPHYILRPFWSEFGALIEAVKIEKFTIGLILQLIVIISIFNIMAFIIYLNEKRTQEIFLFQALGVSKGRLAQIWFLLSFIIWGSSCGVAVFLAQAFDFLLQNLSLFHMPGDIYNLSRLSLKLDVTSHLLVFTLALLWVLLMTYPVVWGLKKKSIIQGLRKEYS